MRIMQLAPISETVPPPAYGGTETVISCLTEELVRQGHEVVLYASGDSITSADLRYVFPQSLRGAGLIGDPLPYSLVHFATALREAGDFDVVHSHSGPPLEVGMALSHVTDVPMLTTLHNPLNQDAAYIWQSYAGWYNTISHQQRTQLPCLPNARCAGVVHNAIEVESFPFQVEKQDYLLFMGRMCADKAPHLAIEAARRSGRRIILAGKMALPYEQEYFDALVRPLLDGVNAEFIGEADGSLKRELYAGAAALLMPLQWEEPFGLVMIEAMACGTPAIVFNRGAAPEIVQHGETGYLVQDVDGMVDAIRRVDDISAWRCREHVEQNFGPPVLAERYLDVYERMLGIKEPLDDHLLV